MKHLALENKNRGTDSTGIASWNIEEDRILICKQADEAKDFIPNLKLEHILGTTIGHCRAKTRGDPSNPENNHPMYGTKFCIVHNGMVHSMTNIPEYKYKGECDTEVLLSYIETYGIKGAIPKIDGSAALAIMSPEDNKFYLYRHTSPLALMYLPGKAFVFSSLEYPLKKIPAMLGDEKLWNLFPMNMVSDFDEGTLFSIDMKTFEVNVETVIVESKTTGAWCNRNNIVS